MRCEYLVVGGGVYGCGVARELAREGKDVVLLEAGTIAGAASGGPGKRGVRANGRGPAELPLMGMAYGLWPRLADELDADVGYERTGHLLLYEEERNALTGGFAAAEARRWLQERNGVESEVLDAAAVREKEPGVDDRVVGALYCPNDGVVDHTALTRALAADAAEHGATVLEGTPAVSLDRTGTRVTSVETADGETVRVDDTVLLLANTGVPDLVADELGMTLPVWRILPQVMVTEPVNPVPVRHLIGHDSRTLALKEVPGDRVMISGGWQGEWDESGERGTTVPEHVEANAADARTVFPDLEGVAIEEADASRPETSSVDGHPILDRPDGATNAIVGTGWTGHGFAISPAVTRLLAEWATTGVRPDLLAPFSYDRFA